MRFCPSCANTLQLQRGSASSAANHFSCPTCPYIHPITRPLRGATRLERKAVDDVLGGARAWENVDSTEERCPRCEHPRAYFLQVQTRSADEPMTVFYKCANHDCGHQWRER